MHFPLSSLDCLGKIDCLPLVYGGFGGTTLGKHSDEMRRDRKEHPRRKYSVGSTLTLRIVHTVQTSETIGIHWSNFSSYNSCNLILKTFPILKLNLFLLTTFF
jgi:hypothetical protein